MAAAALDLAPDSLHQMFELKYGSTAEGWRPAMDRRFGYFSPDEHYECVIAKLVTPDSTWLDVGCGREIFPNNARLTRLLADRCRLIAGVDPSDNLNDNPYLKERYRSTVDQLRTNKMFDLITMRMVAEHVDNPEASLASLRLLAKPGGKLVIYTVHKWSPLAVLARVIPFGLHHRIKSWVWKSEERDTFPVAYKMNTRRDLTRLLREAGFVERTFAFVSDAHTFFRFPVLHCLELSIWKALQAFGWNYPERCLIGVYERTTA
jgi:2-polyprenyl-3-methyl-5-hydroxy-6-metoxy-1,4-benzoquinol methylase